MERGRRERWEWIYIRAKEDEMGFGFDLIHWSRLTTYFICFSDMND